MLTSTSKAIKNETLTQENTDHFYDEPQQKQTLLNTISILRNNVFLLEQKLVQMQYFAYHDDLTGLPNRSLFHDRVNQAIKQAARNHTKMSLLLLDLNGFKDVNDTFGHVTGDKLLKKVSKRLLSGIRAEDSVYRYGGDEFFVLLPEVDDSKGATELIRKLYQHLAKPYILGHHSIAVTASIGKAVYPDDGTTLTALILQADADMYLAKTQQ